MRILPLNEQKKSCMTEAVQYRQLTYVQAIREGLELSMRDDQRVIVIGEGVPDPKAIFSSTAGLQEKFGAKRVFDMPLAENGITGVCIGAALNGLRPVMIHQRIDFAMLAMDQIINNAAKWHYMFDGNGSVPIVIRMIVGRGWGQGPQHSQSLQALFAHIPGLKVVMPTTAYDAKGMMIAAIRDDNPVIFIEHRWLHHVKDRVPEGLYEVPITSARVLKKGTDLTVASFSLMSMEALIAAKALQECFGLDVEVVDMRSVSPLDLEAVQESVRKTGALLVADTANYSGSVASEVISRIVEGHFSDLKVAPVRIASPDHPVPTSHFMASSYYPGRKEIADAVLKLMNYSEENEQYQKMLSSISRDGPHDAPDWNFSGPF